MRLLIFVLNLVVGASLSVHSIDALSAGKSHKHGRSKHHSHHKTVIHDPGNVWDRVRAGMRLPKPNPPQAFSNIISRPTFSAPTQSMQQQQPDLSRSSADALSEREKAKIQSAELAAKYTQLGLQHQLLNRNRIVTPSIATAPIQNYTRYGRQRLNAPRPDMGESNLAIAEAMQNRQGRLLRPNPYYLTPGANARTRIRTQLAPPSANAPGLKPNINSEVIAQGRASIPNNPNSIAANIANGTKVQPRITTTLGQQLSIASTASSSTSQPASTKTSTQLSREEELWQRQATIYGRVKKQVNYYTQHPDYLQRVAERSRPYIYHIVDELSRHNMPMELALLPIVESAFQATAQSPMSAAGIWQFIPGTGRDFNLVQNENYDARLDVAASTRAAARFLSGLRSHFGDWLLALAAYNCGQGTVDAAINTNRAAGLGTDYWSLNLPAETMDYVPRLLAVAQIFSNPGAYGVRISPIRNEPYFTKVSIHRKSHIDYLAGKDLATVAKLADLSVDHFCRLNPAYIQGRLNGNGPFTFLMPGANANKLQDNLESIAKFLGQPTALPKNAPVKAESTKTTTSQAALPSSIISDSAAAVPSKPATISSPFISLDIGDAIKQLTH